MLIKLKSILVLEGFVFPGYISVDGKETYACFNECTYGHIMLKDNVIKHNNRTNGDDLDGYIKFYLKVCGKRIVLDRICDTYSETRGGFLSLNTLSSDEVAFLRDILRTKINTINGWFNLNPYVDTNRGIIWNCYELIGMNIPNMSQYYSGFELTYDTLSDV